jgi:hypothetical protein
MDRTASSLPLHADALGNHIVKRTADLAHDKIDVAATLRQVVERLTQQSLHLPAPVGIAKGTAHGLTARYRSTVARNSRFSSRKTADSALQNSANAQGASDRRACSAKAVFTSTRGDVHTASRER